jgi:hypothetical protein
MREFRLLLVCAASILTCQCALAQFSARLYQSTVYEGQSWQGNLQIYSTSSSYRIDDFNSGSYSFSGAETGSGSGTLGYYDPISSPAPYSGSELVSSITRSFSSSNVFTQDSNGSYYTVTASASGNISRYNYTGTQYWNNYGDATYVVSPTSFQFQVLNVAPTVTGMQFGTSAGSLSSSVRHVNEGQTIYTQMYASDPGADSLQFQVQTDHSSPQFLGVGNTTTAGAVRYSDVRSVQVFDGFTGAVRDDEGWAYLQPTNLVIHNLDPIFDGWSLPTDVLAGDLFSFNASAHDPGRDSLVFDWDFDGDGLYDEFTGSSGQYSYSSNGTYTVGLRISDGDGGFAYQSQQVTVTPEPHSIALFGCGMLGLFGWRKRRRRRAAHTREGVETAMP